MFCFNQIFDIVYCLINSRVNEWMLSGAEQGVVCTASEDSDARPKIFRDINRQRTPLPQTCDASKVLVRSNSSATVLWVVGVL